MLCYPCQTEGRACVLHADDLIVPTIPEFAEGGRCFCATDLAVSLWSYTNDISCSLTSGIHAPNRWALLVDTAYLSLLNRSRSYYGLHDPKAFFISQVKQAIYRSVG